MTDNWDDDSDDDWDVDDDALDAKLGLNKKQEAPKFDDEEDLAVKEKLAADKARQENLKKKGSALAAKKQAEKEQAEELEIARKAMELEAEMEAKMTPDERARLERQRIEEADHALTDDLFGGVDKLSVSGKAAQMPGDKVVMKDMKDHMKHARKVAECMRVSFCFVLLFVRVRKMRVRVRQQEVRSWTRNEEILTMVAMYPPHNFLSTYNRQMTQKRRQH